MATFLSIPLEARCRIYKILGAVHKGINLHSPRPYFPGERKNFTGLACMRLVCRQTNAEAKALYYSWLPVHVGNGPRGKTYLTSCHGLTSFLGIVPPADIAQIQTVVVQLHGRIECCNPKKPLGYISLGTQANCNDVRYICNMLARYFVGLQNVSFKIVKTGDNLCSKDSLGLTQAECTSQLAIAMKILLLFTGAFIKVPRNYAQIRPYTAARLVINETLTSPLQFAWRFSPRILSHYSPSKRGVRKSRKYRQGPVL